MHRNPKNSENNPCWRTPTGSHAGWSLQYFPGPRPSITRLARRVDPTCPKAASQQPRTALSCSWLTLGGPTRSRVTEEEGGPGCLGHRRARLLEQILPNWTHGPASNQAAGLLLPIQTSISTKILQEGTAALSETDSSGLESLPCCIFNVLTYSFHGPGFMEAPPYRLPGQWLPTAPRALPNGKVRSCGKDTHESLSAGGRLLGQFCVPPAEPARFHKGGGRATATSQTTRPPWLSPGPSGEPQVLQSSS